MTWLNIWIFFRKEEETDVLLHLCLWIPEFKHTLSLTVMEKRFELNADLTLGYGDRKRYAVRMENGQSLPNASVSSTSHKLSLRWNLHVELNGLFSLNCPFSEENERTACKEPPFVENGTANPRSKLYYSGDKVTYTCESGYHLRGPGEITCTRGKWTLPPACVGMCAAFHLQSYARHVKISTLFIHSTYLNSA